MGLGGRPRTQANETTFETTRRPGWRAELQAVAGLLSTSERDNRFKRRHPRQQLRRMSVNGVSWLRRAERISRLPLDRPGSEPVHKHDRQVHSHLRFLTGLHPDSGLTAVT